VTSGTLFIVILTVPFRLMIYIILCLRMLLPLEHNKNKGTDVERNRKIIYKSDLM
jgi:hypothetical protein